MTPHDSDEQFLRRAFDLAQQGTGLASPNPYVGAVLADAHGNIVGTGTYAYAGIKHAEILALEAAGERARGGTLFINLEPHGHQGRTRPCTEALIKAGVRRVVASMPDPNPKVSGKGFDQLRAAGVQVAVGGLADEARHLNEAFARYIRDGRPFVTLKAAMTLDGKIAAPPAEVLRQSADTPAGGWVTGEVARVHVQKLRHQHDALMVGVGTILADNPLLTDRSGRSRRRKLLRVILDSRLRVPIDSRLVQDIAGARGNDVVVFHSSGDPQKQAELESLGIRVEKIVGVEPGARPPMRDVLRRLGELEITSIMIEGGATVNWAALAENLADKVFLYYAPKILAGTGSIPFAAGVGFQHMNQAVKVRDLRLHRFGEDFAVEGYLQDPYSD
jgi:diaminohydroxyphosphoribosylaminopyrimidine deaminase/5-amino-6-(5-phosphoribosylamino)uracil reductase